MGQIQRINELISARSRVTGLIRNSVCAVLFLASISGAGDHNSAYASLGKRLLSPNDRVRTAANNELRALDSEAREALLRESINDLPATKTRQRRLDAIRFLSVLPGDRRTAVRPLVEIGKSKNEDALVHASAIRTLSMILKPIFEQAFGSKHGRDDALSVIDPDGKEAVQLIVRCLDSDNIQLRRVGLMGLLELARFSQHSDVHEEFKKTIPVLVRLINDGDSRTRIYSIVALGEFQDRAKSAVPALLKVTGNHEVASHALRSLVAIDPYREEVRQTILRALSPENDWLQGAAASVVAGMPGPIPTDIVQAVITVLRTGNPNAASSAAQTLARIKPEPIEALPHLLAVIENKKNPAYLRQGAFYALGNIPSAADQTCPRLAAALKIENANIRYMVSSALETLEVAAVYGWSKTDHPRIKSKGCRSIDDLISALHEPKIQQRTLDDLAQRGDTRSVNLIFAFVRTVARELAREPANESRIFSDPRLLSAMSVIQKMKEYWPDDKELMKAIDDELIALIRQVKSSSTMMGKKTPIYTLRFVRSPLVRSAMLKWLGDPELSGSAASALIEMRDAETAIALRNWAMTLDGAASAVVTTNIFLNMRTPAAMQALKQISHEHPDPYWRAEADKYLKNDPYWRTEALKYLK